MLDKDWSNSRDGHGAQSQARDGLQFAVHKVEVAHFTLDSRSLPIPNILELHREGCRFHCSRQRFPHRCPSTRDCQFHCQHMQRDSRQPRVGNKDEEKKLGHTNNRVVTRILMIIMQKKDMCSSSSSPNSQIAIDSARSVSEMSTSSPVGCTCPPLPCGDARGDSVSFARRSSVVPGLPVRSPFDGGLCGGCVPAVDVLRILQKSGLAFASGISPEFALVPLWGGSRECSTSPETAHIRCRDDLLAELVQPFHLDHCQPRILRHWAIDECCKHQHEGLSHVVSLLPFRRLAVCLSLRLGCCERLE